jgi:hypothetical protein
MFRTDCGKLMVYTSTVGPYSARLQSVRKATKKTAELLNLGFEVLRFEKSFSQIFVYYENGDNDPIPIYCDEGKTCSQQEICTILKNMMFVLSFHPKHSALRQVQREIMRLS